MTVRWRGRRKWERTCSHFPFLHRRYSRTYTVFSSAVAVRFSIPLSRSEGTGLSLSAPKRVMRSGRSERDQRRSQSRDAGSNQAKQSQVIGGNDYASQGSETRPWTSSERRSRRNPNYNRFGALNGRSQFGSEWDHFRGLAPFG